MRQRDLPSRSGKLELRTERGEDEEEGGGKGRQEETGKDRGEDISVDLR